jgi:hypothetical protein
MQKPRSTERGFRYEQLFFFFLSRLALLDGDAAVGRMDAEV